MDKFECLALAVSKLNGGFEPGNHAFELLNPGLLRTYRPERKSDSEHYRIFSTVIGGLKALISDMQAKCKKLDEGNVLKDLLMMYGFKNDASWRQIVLFLRKATADESVTANTKLTWFQETD